MDESLRGLLERFMDDLLKSEFTKDSEWVENVIPITSQRDVALGYALGYCEAFALSLLQVVSQRKLSEEETGQDMEVVRSMIRRRLLEIVEKIGRELNR